MSAADSELSSPPWGILLKRARESRRPKKLSMRSAAIMADVSETTWRHAEGGFEVKGGMRLTYRVGASTLARMALAVDIGPDELTAAGRDDAADILADMLARGEPDPEAELIPQCIVERGVFSTPGISREFKLLFARQHRGNGHTEDCGPFEAADAPRAAEALAS